MKFKRKICIVVLIFSLVSVAFPNVSYADWEDDDYGYDDGGTTELPGKDVIVSGLPEKNILKVGDTIEFKVETDNDVKKPTVSMQGYGTPGITIEKNGNSFKVTATKEGDFYFWLRTDKTKNYKDFSQRYAFKVNGSAVSKKDAKINLSEKDDEFHVGETRVVSYSAVSDSVVSFTDMSNDLVDIAVTSGGIELTAKKEGHGSIIFTSKETDQYKAASATYSFIIDKALPKDEPTDKQKDKPEIPVNVSVPMLKGGSFVKAGINSRTWNVDLIKGSVSIYEDDGTKSLELTSVTGSAVSGSNDEEAAWLIYGKIADAPAAYGVSSMYAKDKWVAIIVTRYLGNYRINLVNVDSQRDSCEEEKALIKKSLEEARNDKDILGPKKKKRDYPFEIVNSAIMDGQSPDSSDACFMKWVAYCGPFSCEIRGVGQPEASYPAYTYTEGKYADYGEKTADGHTSGKDIPAQIGYEIVGDKLYIKNINLDNFPDGQVFTSLVIDGNEYQLVKSVGQGKYQYLDLNSLDIVVEKDAKISVGLAEDGYNISDVKNVDKMVSGGVIGVDQ